MLINMTQTPEEKITTCQICGRVCKSKNGLISHHGYKRPGDGWQTASCSGARFLPYEISCDRLPPTIEMIKKHISIVETKLEEHINNPPKILTTITGGFYQRKVTEFSLPEKFDAKNPPCCLPSLYCYEGEHSDIRRKYQSDIKYSKEELKYMEERLKNWIAPK
jgi:hypothetical protein